MHLVATAMFTFQYYNHLTIDLKQFVNYPWAML